MSLCSLFVAILVFFTYTPQGSVQLKACHLRYYTEIGYKRIILWHTMNTGLAPVIQTYTLLLLLFSQP